MSILNMMATEKLDIKEECVLIPRVVLEDIRAEFEHGLAILTREGRSPGKVAAWEQYLREIDECLEQEGTNA